MIVFLFQSRKRQHYYTHWKSRLQCQYCEKKFVWKRDLVRHVHSQHERENLPYKCSQCEYAASRPDFLEIHVKNNHAEKKNNTFHNTTQAVDSSFADPPMKDGLSSADFKIFIKENGKEVRRYKCSICEKIVKCPKAIVAHYRSHTGTKPYKAWDS